MVKLYDTFFENKTSKFIRKLPDGDRILICYLKFQLKLLKTEGVFELIILCDTMAEEIALTLNEDVNIVKLLLGALQKANAIEFLNENTIMLTEMQNLIGSEGQVQQELENIEKNLLVLQYLRSNDYNGTGWDIIAKTYKSQLDNICRK